jgi:hypothetical protein
MTDNPEEIKERIQKAIRRYEESQPRPQRRPTQSRKGPARFLKGSEGHSKGATSDGDIGEFS